MLQLHNTLELASQESAEAVNAAREREKNKVKVEAASSTSAESKDNKKPGSDELLPLWWVSLQGFFSSQLGLVAHLSVSHN